MDKIFLIGTGLAIVGVAVTIVAPGNQYVGWILLVLGIGLIIFGCFFKDHPGQLESFQSFLKRKCKRGKKMRRLRDNNESYLKAERWFNNTCRGIGRALGNAEEEAFRKDRWCNVVYLDLSKKGSGGKGAYKGNYDDFFLDCVSYLEQLLNRIEPDDIVAGFDRADLKELEVD